MVDFPIRQNITRIGDDNPITDPLNADDEWFAADIAIQLSADDLIAPVVIDFAYSASAIVEYTLDSGTNWVAFNNGVAVLGGQSRFIRVTNGDLLNFRAKTAGTIIRCIVSIP